MSVKGYITPSGQITIKKCWRYDEDKEIKINMRSFNNAFKRFLEKEKKMCFLPIEKKRKKTRKFAMGKTQYKKILSASFVLLENYKHHPYLITLTYGDKGTTNHPNDDIKAFMKSVRDKPYKAGEYWWVKQLQERGVEHFHILIDIPFFDIDNLRQRWKDIICDQKASYSLNYLDVLKDKITDRPLSKWEIMRNVSGYVSKYCSRSEDVYQSNVFAISNGINFQSIPIFNYELMEKLLQNIRGIKGNTENGIYYGKYFNFAYIENVKAVHLYKVSLLLYVKQLKGVKHKPKKCGDECNWCSDCKNFTEYTRLNKKKSYIES